MKKLKLLALFVIMAFTFTGCGQVTGQCSVCKKEAKLYTFVMEDSTDPSNTGSTIVCKEDVDKLIEICELLKANGQTYVVYSYEKLTK